MNRRTPITNKQRRKLMAWIIKYDQRNYGLNHYLISVAGRATESLGFVVSPPTLKRNANFLLEIRAVYHTLRHCKTPQLSELHPTSKKWSQVETYIRSHAHSIIALGYTRRGLQRMMMNKNINICLTHLTSSLESLGYFVGDDIDEPITYKGVE